MTKSPAPPPAAPRLCPTCGTRVGAAATKCLVCGADLSVSSARDRPGRPAGRTETGARPRLGLFVILVIVILVLAGLGLVAGAVTGVIPILPRSTATATATATLPPTLTPTATSTETPVPTPTSLPPIEYTVVTGDTCIKIAVQFNVSTQSIIDLNRLDPNCILSVGTKLQIPQPTPTPTPLPSATLPAGFNTPIPRTTYTVHAGDTLQVIADFYHIPIDGLMLANGITDPNSIREGQVLIIPLELAVTPGPTSTPTLPPPYPAPNQLLPNDGQGFAASDTAVTLQWASVGELRAGEAYYVVVEDVTCQCARFFRRATTETKVILPVDFRPTDGLVHTYRWNVSTVRERAAADGQTAYDPAGATSPDRIFSWLGEGAPAP